MCGNTFRNRYTASTVHLVRRMARSAGKTEEKQPPPENRRRLEQSLLNTQQRYTTTMLATYTFTTHLTS